MSNVRPLNVYTVSVKGVLFAPSGEVVLLLNEREQWELPGGRIELGEYSTNCLAREILEELDVRVEVGRPSTPNCSKWCLLSTYSSQLIAAS